jgi:monofunctional biosynthetic peptidoglycan transglycosylase
MKTAARWLGGIAAAAFACLAYVYVTLPDVRPLKTSNPTTTAFMELRAAEARASGEKPRHVQHWISYGRISRNVTRAVLVAEDDAFWQHEGVDFAQLQESIEIDWARGRLVRGASTITQQLAKNLYLSPSRNPMRKLRELIIARRLEAELKKARILELYLNVIEWGDGIYGVDAAARTYFGKSAADLGPSDAALLAGAIVNPRLLNPAHPSARLLSRQQLILKRMGAIDPPPAPQEPPPTHPDVPSAQPDTQPVQLDAPDER